MSLALDPARTIAVSYARVDDGGLRRSKIRKLAEGLASRGFHVLTDYTASGELPGETRRAMLKWATHSRWILCICDAAYCTQWTGAQSDERRADSTWEDLLFEQIFCDAHSRNHRLVPVLFDDVPDGCIPLPLRPFSYHRFPAQHQSLYRHLEQYAAMPLSDLSPGFVFDENVPTPLPAAWIALGGTTMSRRRRTPAQRATRQLRDFFIDAFSLDDLKSFVTYSECGGDAVFQDIDWFGSKKAVVSRVVTTLIRHGAIGDSFFAELLDERPQRTLDLRHLEQLWTAHHEQISAFAERVPTQARVPDSYEPKFDISQSATASRTRSYRPIKLTNTPKLDTKPLQTLPGKHLLVRLIDRTKYWRTLIDACDNNRHNLGIVVHGSSHQNVEIFLKRIRAYFRGAARYNHRVWTIGLQSDFRTAVAPADWGNRLRSTLGRLDLPLVEALEDATKSDAAMFVFTKSSDRPLHGQDLSQHQRDGLVDFFASYLPDRLVGLQSANPLRFVIPIEYPPYEVEPCDSFYLRICRAINQAPNLDFLAIDPLELPTWHDVWQSIQDIYSQKGLELPPELGPSCRKRFDVLTKKHDCTFADLANGLVDAIEVVTRGTHDAQS